MPCFTQFKICTCNSFSHKTYHVLRSSKAVRYDYECSLEDFLSVAREIQLKDQETVNTEEKNVQEDNSEDSKSKLGDSDCAPWIED